MSKHVVRGGVALGALLLVLAVGVGLTVPAGLSSPGDNALAAARGGACSWPYSINCSNNSVCVPQGGGWSIYCVYSGLSWHPFDPEMDYDVGVCRTEKVYPVTSNCTGGNFENAWWWICT